MARIIHPYQGSGRWLRGNLHAHTTRSDGELSPEELVRAYEAAGYDFLAITDHDMLTPVEEISTRLILLPGCEVTAGGSHMVALGVSLEPIDPFQPRQAVVDAINAQGGIAIPAHPNWERAFSHWKQEELASLQGYAGVEVFNGLVRRHPGNPVASERWDLLLSEGRRLWGYGSDDTHQALDIAAGWTMVLTQERTKEAILQALRAGSCYASSGVFLHAIEVETDRIRIVARNADRIVFIGPYGRWLQWSDASTAEYHVRGDEGYVRVEAYGPHGTTAWTQPFFIAE